ncbi:hypothetical protein QP794_07345 [Paenibacillus sp. UMB7766-LJ446]|nr:hypothetical protein [Paenibacillus sp. UMB7766-LJ446]MDK8189898.1 hypothetical protein [Paenibacillus sp. UMB7766-LJ446]
MRRLKQKMTWRGMAIILFDDYLTNYFEGSCQTTEHIHYTD